MIAGSVECPCGATTVITAGQLWTHCDGCGLIVRKPSSANNTDIERHHHNDEH